MLHTLKKIFAAALAVVLLAPALAQSHNQRVDDRQGRHQGVYKGCHIALG